MMFVGRDAWGRAGSKRVGAALLLLALAPGLSLAQVAPGQQPPMPPAAVGSGTFDQSPSLLAQANPAGAAEVNMRVDRLEGDLRSLTGQMEQLMFQMRQLQDELVRSREDTEFRLRELEGISITDGTGAPMEPPLQPFQPSLEERGSLDGTVSDDQLREILLARERGEPPRTLGTLNVDANGQAVGAALGAPLGDANGPLDLSSLTLNAAPEVRPQAPLAATVAAVDPSASRTPADVYQLGYDHILRGEYPQAAATFSEFIGLYPEDRLRPNAHFWLGESHFAMGSYTPAAEQFLAVFNNYPEDVKVPDALLKLAMSLERLGAQQQACATFSKLLADYPRAPQIVLDTAQTEQGLAGC